MTSIIKILITDDSQTIKDAIENMLKNDPTFNFEILMANDGIEGCKIAYKEKPDIILMDIEMPLMDGIKATKKIKSNNQIKNIPVIVMSTTNSLKNAFLAGADDFIIKPFTEFELLLRLNFNINLAQKTKKLEKQNILLKKQNKQVEEQNEIISRQQKDVYDDISYASHIQNAIHPANEIFKEFCKSHFVFNLPKSIVSGDFYWAAKKENKFLFAVGDCTGHGISGALMTMVGNAFLNEVSHNINYDNPGNILDELRKRIIDLLNQKGDVGEASNGMDISLCIYDPEKKELEYAGANNPIYIIRENLEIEVFKADRMPIGIYIDHSTPFSYTKIKINPGDNLYLFSDGYADQFGGSNGKKFRYKQFRELLISCASEDMNKQQKKIESTFHKWTKGFVQIDDILILGIKF